MDDDIEPHPRVTDTAEFVALACVAAWLIGLNAQAVHMPGHSIDFASEAGYPEGMNVEFVALGPGRDEITMRVWERGVGETLACGSGACAAAAAVHAWGKVGTKVTVHQPGGASEVDVGGPTVVLTGPSQLIATIEVA